MDEELLTLDEILEYLRATDPASWWAGPTFRSPDGTQHCVLSHIADRWGMDAMGWFEERWSTSYVIGGAVNDGPSEKYPQAHPKDRCIAFIEALRDGSEDSTPVSIDKQWLAMGGTVSQEAATR